MSSKTTYAQQQIDALGGLSIHHEDIHFIYNATDFKKEIIQLIRQAQNRIYMTALYWEKDEAGQQILDEIYLAKQRCPQLEVKIFVDWHRAQRSRMGDTENISNADWYALQRQQHQKTPTEDNGIMIYGVPINTREVFGVLHIKGFVFDDYVLYSGASINNVYLHQQDKYRFDRYHRIYSPALAQCMVEFSHQHFMASPAVLRLDEERPSTKEIRQMIRVYRKELMQNTQYCYAHDHDAFSTLCITPLFGLGNNNSLNKTIEHLFELTQEKLTICTPYFNIPKHLQLTIQALLENHRQVEIIVGDKTANDFYSPPDQDFHISNALPYLYEKNLRHFAKKFQHYLDTNQLVIRLWKEGENSYHLKGVWVDNHYLLITGNNLNPRAWRLDAENGLLIRDPQQLLQDQIQQELTQIRQHASKLTHFSSLEEVKDYPKPVRNILKKFSRIKADKIVNMIL